jgi:ParB family chromosome partitioning protein
MPQHIASGALRAMSLSLERMSTDADEARDLKSKIAAGEHVLNLDPDLVDASFVRDRIPIENDAEFDAFVKGIAEQGQQVPILVRPNPSSPERYQVAYGHRRLRAAAQLGIPIRAIVKPLTDVELVVAQAKENLDRQDLSYVERALLARQLEGRQFERAMIMSALGVDKGDLSRLLAVANGIPDELIQAIGPAPRIGRPRWVQLVELIKSPAVRKRALAVVSEQDFRRADTNQRFALVMRALMQPLSTTPRAPADLRSTTGQVLARLDETSRRVRLSIHNPEFRAFFLSRLPSLVSEFEQDESVAKS